MQGFDQVIRNVHHCEVDGETSAHVKKANLIKLCFPEPVAPDHWLRRLNGDQIGAWSAGHTIRIIAIVSRALTNANVKDSREDEANAENEKGHLLKGDRISPTDGISGVHSKENEHQNKYGYVGEYGASVTPGIQFHALSRYGRQIGNERQMRDLHSCPAKLENSANSKWKKIALQEAEYE